MLKKLKNSKIFFKPVEDQERRWFGNGIPSKLQG